MTSVCYSDCIATSPNFAYTVTAKSPFNGEILDQFRHDPRQDFQRLWPSDQTGFRYQLIDDRQQVVWERWQPKSENSPAELIVSDWGDVVVRTHGVMPSIIVVQNDGTEVTAFVVGKDWALYKWFQLSDDQPRLEVDLIAETSAGSYWSTNSWPYFTEVKGGRFFVWRTATGQRFVFDLHKRIWLSQDSSALGELQESLDDTEINEACLLLEELSSQKQILVEVFVNKAFNEEPYLTLSAKLRRMAAAALIVGQFNVRRAALYLLTLEELDCTNVYRSFGGFGFFNWVEVQALRLIIQQSLRLVGVVPQGYSPYYLRRRGKRVLTSEPTRIELRSKPDKCLEFANGVGFWHNPRRVINHLGIPDYIENELLGGGRWNETWEYDLCIEGLWKNFKIHWKQFGLFWSRFSAVEIRNATHDLYSARLQKILSDNMVTL